MMKPLLFVLCAVFAFGVLTAQQAGWQPSTGHTQVPIEGTEVCDWLTPKGLRVCC